MKTKHVVDSCSRPAGRAVVATMTPSKPLSELTPQEAAGHQVFVSQCSSCHYADTEKGLHGPGLEGLFRKPYLPSGMAGE